MRDLIDRYLQTWNATDEAERAELLATYWTPECTYVDPLAGGQGVEEVSAIIGAVHSQFPGWRFSLIDDIDSHHQQARFRWGLGTGEQDFPIIGFDVLTADSTDRIHAVYGFLDKVPA